MRILHTSDWHLGRSFGPVSLHADQAVFLDWMVELAVAESVDVVVVAGDLYDRAIPPTESVALLRDTLARLVARGIRVVAIAGNHDGPDRVSAYDGLTDLAGVHVRGGYARAGEAVVIEADDGPLHVVPVPYLDPVLAPGDWAPVESGPLPAPVVDVGAPAPLAEPIALSLFDEIEAEVATPPVVGSDRSRSVANRTHHGMVEAALARARAARLGPRSILVAHAFVTGGQSSDSERLLTVGGTGQVTGEVFDGFSYVALGHLHRPQAVGSDTVRYSGTPLPYSFSETHTKQVVLVDLAPDGTADVRPVDVPTGRPVATVTGRLEELLASRRHHGVTDHFVRAVLTDPAYVVDAKGRLLDRFPHVVEIVLAPERGGDDPDDGAVPAVRGRLSPLDATLGFWRSVAGEEPDTLERALLESALAHVASAEVDA